MLKRTFAVHSIAYAIIFAVWGYAAYALFMTLLPLCPVIALMGVGCWYMVPGIVTALAIRFGNNKHYWYDPFAAVTAWPLLGLLWLPGIRCILGFSVPLEAKMPEGYFS